MEPTPIKTTEQRKNHKALKISVGADNKQSTKSADDKVLFQVSQHFVDDYQHYPGEEQRFIIKHENHEIAYSLCELEKYWTEMIAEDREVTITIKHGKDKNNNE
jgi:hypothetical protein